MIMSNKWKYLFGCASLVAAVGLPSKLTAATMSISLVPVSGTNGDVTINGQNVTVTNVGDTVVMDVYANIQNADGNWSDDAFSFFKAALQSLTSTAGGLQGNFNGGSGAPMVTDTAATQNAFASGKEIDNADPGQFTSGGDPLSNTAQASAGASGTLLVWGAGSEAWWGTNPNGLAVNGDTAAANPSTPSSTSPFSVLLGTVTWTDTAVTAGTTATVSIGAQPGLTGSATLKQVASYYSDATGTGGTGGQPSTGGNVPSYGNASLLFGSPVVISPPANVPEPASLGLIGLGITALGVRARRRSARA
jgi:hypothetical protein